MNKLGDGGPNHPTIRNPSGCFSMEKYHVVKKQDRREPNEHHEVGNTCGFSTTAGLFGTRRLKVGGEDERTIRRKTAKGKR